MTTVPGPGIVTRRLGMTQPRHGRTRWRVILLSALLMVAPRVGVPALLLLNPVATIGPVVAAEMPRAPAARDEPPELAALLRALENPESRDRLIAALKTLPPTSASAPAESLGARWLRYVAGVFDDLGDLVDTARRELGDPHQWWGWLAQKAASRLSRDALLHFLLGIGLVIGTGGIAAWIIALLTGGWRRRLQAQTPRRWTRKLPAALALASLELLHILAFAAVAYAMIAVVRPEPLQRLCVLAVVHAALLAQVAVAAVRLALLPMAPGLRLPRIEGETAAYLYVWSRRLIHLGVYGYFALQLAALLRLPPSLYEIAIKLLGLVLIGLVAVLVLQNHRAVAASLRGPDAASGRWSTIRRRLADVWHVVALGYLIAAYVIWALDRPNGFSYLWRASALSVLAVAVAKVALGLVRVGYRQLVVINRELLARYPLLEWRANRYLPLLRGSLEAVVYLAAAIAILQAWQVDALTLLENQRFQDVVLRLFGVLLIAALAMLAWDVADTLITGYLQRKDPSGQVLLRSARVRTLLPLVRNAVLVVIWVIVVLTVLSQLGVNIGPLLAGAGVAGLAIGFGAQTLVKDVITGAFILFEETINIGDVATINGVGGLVEGLSIRTVRLRDKDGTLHTIPFSAITTVSNMTKEYSYYFLDVVVAHRENPDRVIQALREVFADLAADPKFKPDILGDLEVWGVDSLADSGMHIAARIRTPPIRQWDVGREFNRRMKLKFDELDIERPFGRRQLYFANPLEMRRQGANDPSPASDDAARTSGRAARAPIARSGD